MIRGTAYVRRARIGTVMIALRWVWYQPPGSYDDRGNWVKQPMGLKGATIAKVALTKVAEFRKELEVEKFKLEPAVKEGE
jgi:hypothetical protein